MRLNAVIICDDSESNDLKPLFSNLMRETSNALCAYKDANNIDLTLENLTHERVDVQSLSERLSNVNQNDFLCYVYSHGECDKVQMDGETIVSTTTNQYLFSNALIYTFSCSNGSELADVLIDNGAKLFVGYTDNAWFTIGCENEYTERIAMTFVNSFLNGNNAQKAFEDLKESYNNVIFDDSLKDPILKGNLRKNRDCLTLKGDGNLRISDVKLN
ncbi:MAG: hypothetical protein MJZ52_03955 [Bacteroidales bacterium]|nr:hypothetical protein [Bacteroidales bacterium]